MSDLEENWAQLVEHYAPRSYRPESLPDRVIAFSASAIPAVLLGGTLSTLILGRHALASWVGWIFIFAGVVSTAIWLRWSESARRRRWVEIGEKGPTPETAEVVVEGMRHEIDRHRQRTLGPNSEWGRTRAALDDAHSQARSSVAYWKERLRSEEESPLARDNLRVAESLSEKFERALRELDIQVHSLREFFDLCEVRLLRMTRFTRDLEESERLRSLSARADQLVVDAREILRGIAAEFLADAVQVSSVLTSFEEVRLLELAGEAEVDQLEEIAEELIQTSKQQQERLRVLVGQVSGR